VPPPDLPSRSYGEYDVESFLGKGSIGKVYLARHRRIGRRVALKTVHLEQKFEDEEDRTEFYKRLQREAELCAAMQHPNVVTLYDVGYDGEVVSYFATEYIDGESLLARLKRTRPLPLTEALTVAEDLLRGLAYAHSKGIIHRDIKPANILLTSSGQAKIADFGVARPLHSSLTVSRSLVGTPNYMSPEQVKTTPVSPRSDLFSAGIVMYEMLTGAKPFGAPDLSAILYNVVNHTPKPANEVNPAVPETVARVVARLLAKKPEDRYDNATDALSDLDRAARGIAPQPPGSELETIAITPPNEETTPLATVIDTGEVPLSRMHRPVPQALFWSVTILLIAALIGAVATLRQMADEITPIGVITPQQIAEADAKRRELAAIRAQADAGQYEEAIAGYDAYVARYPQSIVAQSEREELRRVFEESKAKTQITSRARKPARQKVAAKEDPQEPPPKPLSRWQRFRKWLREEPK
jgi:serine/threonine protein kinase